MPNLATDLARVMECMGALDVIYDTRPIADYWAYRDVVNEMCFKFMRDHGPEIAETFKETPNG